MSSIELPSCRECLWCRLKPSGDGWADHYCEARRCPVDQASLGLRCCDKFEAWRGPVER